MVVQKIRLPPLKDSTASLDYRLSIAYCDVFIEASRGRLYVVCKGFCPSRCARSGFLGVDKKYVFECDGYEECINTFLDLSKELLRSVPYYG